MTLAARWDMRSLSTSLVEDPRSAPFHLCQPGTHPGGVFSVERLRMPQADATQPFRHEPVMLDEIVEVFGALASLETGVLIDATLGGAGHSSALLEAYPNLNVLGLDQDDSAIAAATERLARFGERVQIRKARFDDMAAVAAEAFPDTPVVGVLFDLGISSHQVDVAGRGFSYRQTGPLDMRMDRSRDLSADVVVNTYDLDVLTDVLRDGGEDKFARRVAQAIVKARPINDTAQLAEVVRNAIPAPARRRPGDPAKRSFQAIRLEVNQELDVLDGALDAALALLAPGGICVTLAYHSGEDRMIKRRFIDASTGGCTCPVGLPCVCGAKPTVRLLTRGALKPSAAETETNPRAESARMRAIAVLDVHDLGEQS